MKAIIHIGLEKTGTTTIQNFIYKNKKTLESKNIFLTKSFGYPNNNLLSYISIDQPSASKNNFKNHDFQLFKKNIIKKAKIELSDSLNKHNFLFSSEHLHSQLKSQKEISHFKKTLHILGFKSFSIIVTLRPIIEMHRSRISTAFKNGNFVEPKITEPWKFKTPHIYQIKNTLKDWMSVFGENNINAIRYSRKTLLRDFFEIVDKDISLDHLKSINNKNKSLSYEIMEAIYSNKILIEKNLPLKDQKINFVNTLINVFEMHPDQNKISISRDAQIKYNKSFQLDSEFTQSNFNFSIDSKCITEKKQISNKELILKINDHIKKII